MNEDNTSNSAASGTAKTITVEATTGEAMHELGKHVAHLAHGGDVILLSGPLGAGKTTFAQGFGAGLNISEPIVSPTFTIARELKDELESLGLDEELEDPSDNTIILMEWGEQMAAALAPERLEIHIDRPLNTAGTGTTANTASRELTSNGVRTVTFIPVGESWQTFDIARNKR